jgi:tRNA G10  N-methylase Trm11
LKEPDLAVTRKTDFEELKAKIIFLDIAIASGSFSPFENAENEKIFNEQVDELAAILAALTRKINDSGMKLSRAEAKSVIEWIQKRISLSVRTKRQRKADIFQTLDRAEDHSIPQQRAYMQNFLKKA